MAEPARALPLRFGTYETRYLLALIYLVAGPLLIAASNTYTVPLLLVGAVAHLGGWYVLPGRGARRAWMAWPSLIACFVLLAGPQYLVALTVLLLAWLVVRQRPALSYLSLLIPLFVGVTLASVATAHEDEPAAMVVEGAAVVTAAWVAHAIAASLERSTARPRE